jgi:hypothetical protein
VTEAANFLKELMEKNPPYGCGVTLDIISATKGWDAPPMLACLRSTIAEAS